MTKYKALIVEDEMDNIAILRHFVTTYCLNLEIIGHAMNVVEAISEINTKKPDIIFLDIRLKDGNAFNILDKIENIQAQVIFVTSHEEYAIKAIKYNAIDYILKPIAIEDVILAVNKAVKNLERKDYFDFQNIQGPPAPFYTEDKDYVSITSIDKIDFIKTNQIEFIEADNQYTILHTRDKKKYTSNKSLSHFEKECFFRIHNSYIINIEYIVRIIKKDGNYCEMASGALLPISKRRKDAFYSLLKIKN